MALRKRFAFAARALAATFFLAGILLLWAQQQVPAQAQSAQRKPSPAAYVHIIDGETIEDLRAATIYRLANVEIAGAEAGVACPAAARIGERATAATVALIARARRLEVLPTGQRDPSGRPTAYIAADGHDLGEALIDRGFGRPERDMGQPWCDAAGALVL
jgi:endonuclease YncB( thermonuclease family)